MKLRKAYIYLLSFAGLAFMFTACYYFSYKRALYEFNKNAVERDQRFADLQENDSNNVEQSNETASVDTISEEVILPNTAYILEIYDMKTNKIESEQLNPPGYLIGLTREKVIEYLEDYMSDMTLSEYNKGLMSYELVSFSGEKVVLRKSYNEDLVPYRYYVVVKNGYVVVYNSDLKSVYKYTFIEAKNLSEEDRIALSKGIYVNSLEELYGLLESYTS